MTTERKKPAWAPFLAGVLCVVVVHAAARDTLSEGPTEGDEQKPMCAQICVDRVCRILGIDTDMKMIITRMPPREGGNSLAEIRDTLAWIGLRSDGLRTDYTKLRNMAVPVIAHFPEHFVVLTNVAENSVTMIDGYGRRRTLLQDEFRTLWDGKILAIVPPEKDRFLPVYKGPPAPGSPRVCFRTLIVDAGEIDNLGQTGEAVDFIFEFENRGSGALLIENVRASCACAVSEKPSEPIQRGTTENITIRYDLGGRRGPFQETVYVHTNDPSSPVVALTLAEALASANSTNTQKRE